MDAERWKSVIGGQYERRVQRQADGSIMLDVDGPGVWVRVNVNNRIGQFKQEMLAEMDRITFAEAIQTVKDQLDMILAEKVGMTLEASNG